MERGREGKEKVERRQDKTQGKSSRENETQNQRDRRGELHFKQHFSSLTNSTSRHRDKSRRDIGERAESEQREDGIYKQ